MRSLPLTLVARLLPVAVLTAAGVAMTTSADSDAPARPAASPRPSADGTAPARPGRPPSAPCATIPADTVKDLVPGAKTAGKALDVSDSDRRSGCSWHALDGYDYRWLDVSFEITATGQKGGGPRSAGGTAVPGLGDQATLHEELSTDDDQQTREAVVVVRDGAATVTVTYNGSDYGTGKAPAADPIRKGALAAAKAAVSSLQHP